ncbi:MAG: heterodisulfide reductase, subunit B, partial [bacterium]|nr:heterodisulfide reductase, subunit B [bacterium]
MKIGYYPGCTLKNKAKNFEDTAIYSMETFDIEVEELPRWNCCGTVFSLAAGDLFHQLAPIRILIRAKEKGMDRVTTLCAMCYNTLKRANETIK